MKMKIYEVYALVPYLDFDDYENYDYVHRRLFVDINDAKAYLDKMYNDEEANRNLQDSEYMWERSKDVERRYITESDNGDVIILAITYGGNRWCLREVEVY